MRLTPWRCPECDQPAKGILETIPGIARLYFDKDGTAEYAGETDVCWDDQTSILAPDGRITLICPDGHEWLASMDEAYLPPPEETCDG